MEDLISLLQMGIWIIVAIMVGFVALYIYLMRPQNKNTYNSNNDNTQYDDGLNSQDDDDDGPIQNL